jgi:predicted nucleotidyltransferase component of viral defense system
VRARLLDLSRTRGEDFQLVLTRYGLERLMYRLSQSDHAERFVLKGAMLFLLWNEEPHRPTRDVDFLGFGDMSQDTLREMFQDICSVPVEEDGVTFDPDSVRVEPIRDDTEYGGLRVTLAGELSGARIPVQADIGVGDAVTPAAVVADYPVLLDGAAPALATYPRETVVAEKYQAMVAFGIANSRMKDYYDLWVLAREYPFDAPTLARAIRNTFERRHTALPEGTPLGLRSEFFEDRNKRSQWRAFLSRMGSRPPGVAPNLDAVCGLLDAFLAVPTRVAHDGDLQSYWPPGGPWS